MELRGLAPPENSTTAFERMESRHAALEKLLPQPGELTLFVDGRNFCPGGSKEVSAGDKRAAGALQVGLYVVHTYAIGIMLY